MLWKNNTIHLPEDLWAAYIDELTERSLLETAKTEISKKGIHGGQSSDLAHEHFCHRFGASSGRVVYFLADPTGAFTEATKKTLLSLSRGNLTILDLAGGAGAGTLSILTALASLRLNNQEPKLPTNITIVNADFSTDAQEIAQSMHGRLGSHLLECGIDIIFTTTPWDATDVVQTVQLCDNLFKNYGESSEFLVLISNISGIGNAGFEGVKSSVTHIMQRLTTKRAFVIWLEPETGDAKSILKKVATIVIPLNWLKSLFSEILPSFTYQWFDKINTKERTSGVILQQYSREY